MRDYVLSKGVAKALCNMANTFDDLETARGDLEDHYFHDTAIQEEYHRRYLELMEACDE